MEIQIEYVNQIQLGSEISLKIKPEFPRFRNLNKTIALHYERRNQIWYFFPYVENGYLNTVWINDYVNKAWYKRVIPQNVVTACVFDGYVYTADDEGNIYKEDFGTSFNGEPIKFMWKSPFLALNSPHHRKIIDEFYFLLDTEYDNNFNFSVYKDYDTQNSDDIEEINSIHQRHLYWASDNSTDPYSNTWALDNENYPIWSVNQDILEKAEISESNYSIQLCVTGENYVHFCAITGLQFREIYNDD